MTIPVELQPAVNALVTAIFTLLLAALTWLVTLASQWVREKKNELSTRIGQANFYLIQQQVELIVKAAEQLGITGAIGKTGEEKLAWALQALSDFATKLGYQISPEEARTLIEAAIRKGLEQPATPPEVLPQQ